MIFFALYLVFGQIERAANPGGRDDETTRLQLPPGVTYLLEGGLTLARPSRGRLPAW